MDNPYGCDEPPHPSVTLIYVSYCAFNNAILLGVFQCLVLFVCFRTTAVD
jgi:hypothetical protein